MDEVQKDTEQKGWWKKLYGAGQKVIDAIAEERRNRALRRKFESAYDSADSKIDEAEAKLMKMYEKFDEMDINALVDLNLDIQDLKKVKDALMEEYFNIFAEALKLR